MRAGKEFSQNNVTKRGLVVERDPAKKKVKVKFEDEDETVSMWIDVLARSSGTTKTFMMPDQDDEVWCALDAKGEDGCIIGSKYNEVDTPANSSNDDVSMTGPWGSIHLNKSSGDLTVQLNGKLKVQMGDDITLIAPRIDFEKG